MSKQWRLLFFVLASLLPLCARAATRNVGPGQTYSTIQSAIDAASNGDTVYVQPGTYVENVDFKGKAVTVISKAGPAATIIDGKGTPYTGTVNFQSGEQRNSVLSGFTVRNGGAQPYASGSGGGVHVYQSAPTITNNVVVGNACSNVLVNSGSPLITQNSIAATAASTSAYCQFSGAGILINGTRTVGQSTHADIIGNTVENTTGLYSGIVINAAESTVIQGNTLRNNISDKGAGLYVVNTAAVSILGNLVYGNTTLTFPTVPSGVFVFPANSTVGPAIVLIAGNTIADAVMLGGTLAQTLVINNIIVGSSYQGAMQCGYAASITPAAFDHNDIYSYSGPAYGISCPDQTGTFGNISADPQFVSAATGNYQLLSNSPAIDAGNNSAPSFPAIDFLNNPRVQNGTNAPYPVVDMGAYEITGSADKGHTDVLLTPSAYYTYVGPPPGAPPLSFQINLTSAVGQPYGPTALYEDGTLLGIVDVGFSGTASITPTKLVGGVHSFTAVYPASNSGVVNGPAFFTPGVSARFILIVPKGTSTLTLASSPNPSAYGAAVTFTVTADPSIPTVTLTDTSTGIVLATLTPTAGVATYSYSALAPGTHVITATAAGASAATVSQVVQAAPTTVTLAASPSALYAGRPLSLTAVIASNLPVGAALTGTVTFYSDGTVLGLVTVANGAATLSTTAPSAGTHVLTCVYSGDRTYAPSACSPLTVNVLSSPTNTITFPQPAAPAYAATSVALQALANSGLPITYTVVSGPGAVSGVNGSTLTYLGAGTVVLQADQSGDSTYPAAASVRNTVAITLLTEPLTTPTAPISTLITFLQPGTVANITVSTQGAIGLDFSLGTGSTCAVAATYSAGQTCIANFIFTPRNPGLRNGGIAISDSSGNLLANSYLLGLGLGPQVLYNPPNQTKVGLGFGGLSGIAVDGAGNVYASDYSGAGVYQVSAATGATRLIAPTFQASDVSVDGSGNVFFINRTLVGEVLAVNGAIPANPTVRTILSGLTALNGMKVDANGNVFLASSTNAGTFSAITEILAVNGSIPAVPVTRVLVANVGGPTGVAIDVTGNVYFSDGTGSSVYELVAVDGSIPPSPQVKVITNTFSIPTNVFFDVGGNLYVPDAGTHDVKELLAVNLLLPPSPIVISLGAGLSVPEGGTVDAGGSLFIADGNLAYVVRLAYGSAPTLTFAPTPVNATSSDSPQIITITNGGNADLLIPAPAAGTNASITANFSIGSSSTCPLLAPGAAPATLGPGASCTTAVSFMPTRVGAITGQLVRTDNNQSIAGSTQTNLLNGIGVALPPTIVFAVGPHTFGDPPFTISATSNSSGAFTYSVVSGSATIAGNVVTLTGAGALVLRASEAASGIYAAGSADANITVGKKAQTITFPQPATPVAFGAPITLAATASSGLPVVYSIASGSGRVAGNVVTPTGAGSLVIAADQPGDTNFLPAPQVTRTVFVNFGQPVVTLTGAPNPVFFSNPLTLTSSVTGAGVIPTGIIQFREGTVVLGSTRTANGNAVLTTSSLSVGQHRIVAYYSGDQNFVPAASAAIVITVQDFSIVITNPNLTIKHGGTAVYNVVVTSVGGVGLASTIDLTFSGGPDRSESTITPSSIASGSGTTPATLTMHTPNYPTGPFVLAGLFALVLLPVKRARRWLTVLIVLIGLGAATGCGSGWKSQKWDVQVTARSGALIRTASATLVSTP